MGSVATYQMIAREVGFREKEIVEWPEQLIIHYSKVLKSVLEDYDDIVQKTSKNYMDNMVKGLKHWIKAGQSGFLNWGILLFEK